MMAKGAGKSQGDALANAWYSGIAPPTRATGADDLRSAAAVLQASDDPGARRVAAALERYLTDGGNLSALLGLKVRRGGAYDKPHRQAREAAKARALRALGEPLHGSPEGVARQVAELIVSRAPQVLALMGDAIRVDELPTSAGCIARILRSGPA
jgi:hypothetical protein